MYQNNLKYWNSEVLRIRARKWVKTKGAEKIHIVGVKANSKFVTKHIIRN